jgi:DNA-binding response OmpR family regulator
MNPAGTFDRVATVLLVTSSDEDQQILNRMPHAKWDVQRVSTQSEAMAFLASKPATAVICDESVADGAWQDMCVRLAGMEVPPLLIVAAASADERLWAEVLSLGAYSVFTKPFDSQEAFHVLSFASMLWKKQLQQYRLRALAA